MKTEREQIREMADALSCPCMKSKTCDGCFERGIVCSDYEISEKLYRAGYRKASTVIDEFVELAKERLSTLFGTDKDGFIIPTDYNGAVERCICEIIALSEEIEKECK